MRAICLLMLAVSMSGCVTQRPTVWYKDGADQQVFARDKAQCEYEVESSVKGPITVGLQTEIGRAYDMALQKKKLMDLCLKAKGYTPKYQ